MSISRITHDLSVAHVVPVEYSLGSAQGVRFHRVPAPFTVRLNAANAPEIEVDAPFSIDACGEPIRAIYVSNEAGAGIAVILATDGMESFHGFLGEPAAGGAEQITAALVPIAAGTIADYTKPVSNATEASVANHTMFVDAALQFHGSRLLAPASAGLDVVAELYRANHTHQQLASRHAPGGTARTLADQAPFFMRVPGILIQRQVAAPAGNQWATVGWWERGTGTPGMRYSFGIGFAASFVLGSNNWFAAVIDPDATGAAFDWPAVVDRIIWVDTGILATDRFHALELRAGVSGGIPFIEWLIDRVEVHRHEGAFGSFFNDSVTGRRICDQIRTFRQAANSVDFTTALVIPPVLLGFTP